MAIVNKMVEDQVLDRAYAALSDPTRRWLLETLREVRGREHWVSLRPDGLTMAQQWINEQTEFWSTRADALAARLRRKRRTR